MTLPPDVHAVVLAHLAALAFLLLRAAAFALRRVVVCRSRDLPHPHWLRLLQVLLGVPDG